jgi:hypothetical protein
MPLPFLELLAEPVEPCGVSIAPMIDDGHGLM